MPSKSYCTRPFTCDVTLLMPDLNSAATDATVAYICQATCIYVHSRQEVTMRANNDTGQ